MALGLFLQVPSALFSKAVLVCTCNAPMKRVTVKCQGACCTPIIKCFPPVALHERSMLPGIALEFEHLDHTGAMGHCGFHRAAYALILRHTPSDLPGAFPTWRAAETLHKCSPAQWRQECSEGSMYQFTKTNSLASITWARHLKGGHGVKKVFQAICTVSQPPQD